MFCRQGEKTIPVDYLKWIHNCLSDICESSVFEKLCYHGGPQVKCENYDNKLTVLRCVEYGKDFILEPSCEWCHQKHIVNDKLVRV